MVLGGGDCLLALRPQSAMTYFYVLNAGGWLFRFRASGETRAKPDQISFTPVWGICCVNFALLVRVAFAKASLWSRLKGFVSRIASLVLRAQ